MVGYNFVGNQLKITPSDHLLWVALRRPAMVGLPYGYIAFGCGAYRRLIRNGSPAAANPSTALAEVACTRGPGVPSANMP